MRGLRYLLFGLAIALSGCVAIPTDSDVGSLAPDEQPVVSTAHYQPAGPVAGATPIELVRGFVESMLAYPVTRKIANEYLTEQAAKDWRKETDILVYSDLRIRGSERDGLISVEVALTSRIDASGTYSLLDDRRTISFPMKKIDGEWRITEAPAGVLVSEEWSRAYIQPFSAYFFDDSQGLVPVPVHAVVGDQLATTLVTALAAGPPAESARILQTSMPPVAEVRPSVPVAEGVADVALLVPVADMPEATATRIFAQLNWSLSQIPGVDHVRVTGADGLLVDVGEGVGGDSWRHLGPPEDGRFVHAVADDKVTRIDGAAAQLAPGDWGSTANGARQVVIAGARIAAVRAAAVTVGSVDGSKSVQVEGRGFLTPVIDLSGATWVVDERGNRIRLVEGDEVRSISKPGSARWTSFAVSPDGARWAATTAKGNILVGFLRRSDGHVKQLTRPSVLPVAGLRAQQVQWRDGTVLIATVDDEVRPFRQVRIDGSGLEVWPDASTPIPRGEITRFIVTPVAQFQVAALARDGSVWAWTQSRWVRVMKEADSIG